jgi:hypothetical protein
VDASNNCACATCPTVAMDKARLSLLVHHSSDRTAVTVQLSIATEGYRPLVQRHIVVVNKNVVLKQLVLIGLPIKPRSTRFENKVGSKNVVTGESRIKKWFFE